MTYWTLYWMFFKYGLLCVGGGYVLVPMLMNDLVDVHGWMTAAEFQQLVAVAQITPGPIGINAATYTGFRQLGISGGITATLGLVSPALLMVVSALYCLKKFEKTVWIQGALAGLRPAGFGLVMAAAWIFIRLALPSAGQADAAPVRYILPALMIPAVFLLQIKTKISFLVLLILCGLIGAFLCR